MDATCSRCDHPVGFHGSPAGCRARYLVGDPLCGCDLHPDAYPPHPAEELRRCQAEYHGEHGGFRCEVMVTRETRHEVDVDHRAQNGDRPELVFKWKEDVASYPLRVSDPCGCPPGGHSLTGACLPDVPAPASERQVGGDHYRKHAIQPWDIIDEYDLSFYAGNALKYLLRDKGNRLEDLKKARHYLDKLIEIEEGKEG